jgi:hypothetical protein
MQFKGDSHKGEQAVSGMHSTPLHNPTQQINGAQRIRVAYLHRYVKCLAPSADTGMPLALALVHRCERHDAVEVIVKGL